MEDNPAFMPAIGVNKEVGKSNSAEAYGAPKPQSLACIYGATFATEFCVMLVQIALYKFAALWLGQTGFSEYALARRVLALLQPVTMLGFGVGLPRYVALADGRGESARCPQYLVATFLCVGGFSVVITALLLVFPARFSYLLFGGSERQYLLAPLALMVAGLSLHSILYAFLRGRLAVGRANLLQLVNNGLVPVVVFALFHKDVASLLWYLGLGWIAIAALMLLATPVTFSRRNFSRETSELLRYGLQRVPGDFALMALLSLPAILVAHLGGIHQAGFVAFALAIVNMVASLFSPVGIILLPKVSRALTSGDFQGTRREIVLIRRLVVVVSGTLVVLIELFGGRLIRLYLGPEYTAAVPAVDVLILGALSLAFYYALRSALDAYYDKAVNTVNLVATLALLLTGCGIGVMLRNSRLILWSFASALTILGLLTYREVEKILKSVEFPVRSAFDQDLGASC